MPLVKVDAADDYLDVAHLAEDKGDGGKKKAGTSGGRNHNNGKKTGTGDGDDGGNHNHLDADAMVDVPGLLGRGGISSMIAPRYLSRDSHARPRDVQVTDPHDCATSLDDSVSVITLETCLRQMETGGASISAELSEKEMAMAAARGEYNARIAAMSRQNSEVQGGGEGGGDGDEGDVGVPPKVADTLERQNAYGTNRSEDRRKDDLGLGRSGTDRSSPTATGRGYRGDGRHHHKDSSVAGSRSSRPHNRSSIQDRYSSNANVSGRSHPTHDSRTSASNRRHLHRHLNKHNDNAAASMRTIESEAAHSVVTGSESRASHFTHTTSEGLGASMWSASRSRGDRREEQRRARSRSQDRGKEIMSRVLQEEQEEAEEEAAEAELHRRRGRGGPDEEEKKEGGGGATGASSNRHQPTEESQVSSFSAKETARRREHLTKKKTEEERSNAEVLKEEPSHDGAESLVESLNRRARHATLNPLRRLSVHSLDDELDSVESDVEMEGSSGLAPQSAATRMKSASNALSNLAAEVSSSAKNMSNSAERGARGFLSRHSNIDEEAARRISDLESQVVTLREAFQKADDHCATLEGRLADASSDRNRAEDLIRLLEAENDALKKRVEKLERREFGRAMGMTSGRAGANSNNGGSFTVALNDTDAGAKGEDPLKGSLDAIRKNRAQPFRQGSVKSFNPTQDLDLESVVSEQEPPRSTTASVATGNSGDSSLPTHGNDVYDYQDQERRYERRGGHESDDGSEIVEDQLRALPSENQEKEKGSVPTESVQSQKRGMFGLGKLMSNLHNESFAILETLQEENADGAAKPGVVRGVQQHQQQTNRSNGVNSVRHTVDDAADVADEISHKLSTDTRERGKASNSNAAGRDTRSTQHLPPKSTASGETAATSYMTNSTAPHQTQAGGVESWFRRQRNSIAKNLGGADEVSIAGHSVVSQGGLSVNLAMKEELN